ncbi:MAG: DUF1428 domain-containing protein [Pseudomonadota bacterium]
MCRGRASAGRALRGVYVQGFLAAVPQANKDAFCTHAKEAWAVFKDYGCLEVRENWGVDVPEGKLTSFPMAVKLQEDEAVVLSWTIWPDRATCDAAWEKMMQDPRMEAMGNMPFDGARMMFGGFEPVVHETA